MHDAAPTPRPADQLHATPPRVYDDPGGRPLSRRSAISAIALGTAGLVSGCALAEGLTGGVSRPTLPADASTLPREFRGVWVATVDNIDWPSSPGLSTELQRREVIQTLDAAVRANLNSIFLQVRPTSDAIYPSRNEPWTAFLTGTQGAPPDPYYDPLQFWLDEGHARGLDIHAWINPFRVRHPKSLGPDAPNHIANAHPEVVRRVGPYLWLDPGEPAARGLAMRAVKELLSRYPIDGIHMDDYFYPYPRPESPFPDQPTHARFARGKTLADWRRENINTFVQELRGEVRGSAGHRLLTISPFGIWRPNHPEGIQGFDAYEGLAADSRKWLAEGWCDALIPQLYWPIESKGQPFEPLLKWWIEQNRMQRHVWPGLYVTRIKPAGEAESWEPDQIQRQIELTRRTPGAGGVTLFSMVGLTENRRGVARMLEQSVFNTPALVPASPWASNARMRPPGARSIGGGRLEITASRSGLPARRWAIQRKTTAGWATAIAAAGETNALMPAGAGPAWVTAIGPNGVASDPIEVAV